MNESDSEKDNLIVYNKKNILAKRIRKGHYNISLCMSNTFLDLYSLVDFQTVPFIGKLNSNLFDTIDLKMKDQNNGKIFVLFHHFFENFGINQKYIHILGTKTENENATQKQFSAVNHDQIVSTADQLKMDSFHLNVSKTTINSAAILIECDMKFDIPFPLPYFIESLAIKLCIKFVKFTKAYFENLQKFDHS